MLARYKRFSTSIILLPACLLLSAPAYANLLGQTVGVSFFDSMKGVSKNDTGIVVINPGFEVSAGDMTESGTVMLAGTSLSEYIDIGTDSIEFGIQGGGPAHSTPGFQTTGFGADATYTINFAVGVLGLYETPDATDLTTKNIVGVTLGEQLIFDASLDLISLNVGTLGVDKDSDFGKVKLQLTLAQMSAIPIPATLPLMLSGLLLLGWIARRKKI